MRTYPFEPQSRLSAFIQPNVKVFITLFQKLSPECRKSSKNTRLAGEMISQIRLNLMIDLLIPLISWALLSFAPCVCEWGGG